MSEEKLPVRKGPDLFQQVMPDIPPRDPGYRKPKLDLLVCWECQQDNLKTERIARPGGVWACARGHGLLEVGRHPAYSRRR